MTHKIFNFVEIIQAHTYINVYIHPMNDVDDDDDKLCMYIQQIRMLDVRNK
jgi:hypothetical protein